MRIKTNRDFKYRKIAGKHYLIPCAGAAEISKIPVELTETAACIWLYAEAGQSAEKIACNMAEEFEVDIQTARRAVSAFFNLLVDRGMAIETDSC